MPQRQNFRHIFSYISAASGALLISACTTISTPKTPLTQTVTPQTQWQKYQHSLQDLTQWHASGVIGIVINHKGESANFIWKQNKQNFWIQIYGPLGIGATTFSGDNHQVELKRSNGEVIKSQSLEALMQSQLGWSLPIAGLYYWARGLYMPQVPYSKILNNFGLVQNLKQQGWQIQYKDYMLYDNQYPLAEKIIFRYGDNLKMTLVIKSWLLNP